MRRVRGDLAVIVDADRGRLVAGHFAIDVAAVRRRLCKHSVVIASRRRETSADAVHRNSTEPVFQTSAEVHVHTVRRSWVYRRAAVSAGWTVFT